MNKEKTCPICHKKYRKKYLTKNCSKKCSNISLTKYFEKKCPTCGTIFKKRAVHCSNKCRGVSIQGVQKDYIVKLKNLTEEQHTFRLKESFENNVIKGPGCWDFNGKTRTDGYAALEYKGRRMLVHRASWLIHYGVIPDGIFVLHKCDNRKCSNPDHLFLGTQKDNIFDMVSKGRNRYVSGEKIVQSKLKTEQVIKIKKLLAQNISNKKIAESFNINHCTVSDIKNNKTWKQVSIEEDLKQVL